MTGAGWSRAPTARRARGCGVRTPTVLSGAIEPGLVFDLELPLADVAQASALMHERRATKVLLHS